jgi:hypothetical protein
MRISAIVKHIFPGTGVRKLPAACTDMAQARDAQNCYCACALANFPVLAVPLVSPTLPLIVATNKSASRRQSPSAQHPVHFP